MCIGLAQGISRETCVYELCAGGRVYGNRLVDEGRSKTQFKPTHVLRCSCNRDACFVGMAAANGAAMVPEGHRRQLTPSHTNNLR